MSKYGKYTGDQIEAVLNQLGGETVIDAVLTGDKKVTVEDAVRLLFDKHGRGIPKGLSSSVCDESRSFHLQIPGMDFEELLERLTAAFPEGTVFCTANELASEVHEILSIITSNARLKNCLGRTWFPLALPKIDAGDYGTVLETIFVAAVEKAYHRAFPQRSFTNHRKGTLAGQVVIAHASHERLVARMQQEPLAGIFLPNALQGFSIPADKEFANKLPHIFHLAGGYDFCTAMAGYPDVLARDVSTPSNEMAGIEWKFTGCSLFLETNDGMLEFGGGGLGAGGRGSGGLFLVR